MKSIFIALTIIVALKVGQHKGVQEPVDELLYVLDTAGVKNPKVVACQWFHETGVMKSKIYRENHNPFGMKESRRHWDIGTKNGHANYFHVNHFGRCDVNCYMDAIHDYAEWQKQRGWTGGEDEEYMEFLVLKGYAEDPKYIDRLRGYYYLLF